MVLNGMQEQKGEHPSVKSPVKEEERWLQEAPGPIAF